MDILDIAHRNQQKAWKIVEATRIIPIWESIGAKVNLVGSLRTGLLMKHRDIDFHVYTSEISLSDSFRAMAELAANTSVKKIECVNLLHTVEACIEWHAWCEDGEGELWQIDMIHIRLLVLSNGCLDCFDSRLTFFLIYLSLCYYGRVLHVCVSTGFFAIIETCFYFLYG